MEEMAMIPAPITQPAALQPRGKKQQRSGDFWFTQSGIKHASEKLGSNTGVAVHHLKTRNDALYKLGVDYVQKQDHLSRLIFPRNDVPLPPWKEDYLAPVVYIQQGLKRLLSLHDTFGLKYFPKFDETMDTKVLFPEKPKTRKALFEALCIQMNYTLKEKGFRESRIPVSGGFTSTYSPSKEMEQTGQSSFQKPTLPLHIEYRIGETPEAQKNNDRVTGIFLKTLLESQGLREGSKNDFVFAKPASR
jgi:hypothetical protein